MLQQLFRFHGGVKPPYHKEGAVTQPIAEAPLSAEYVIPLQQSIGRPPEPIVKPGEKVLRGQIIGSGLNAPAIHASTSGTVKAVEMRRIPHTSGLAALCVVIEPDGEDKWFERIPFDYRNASIDKARAFLREAGIVGLGGAVFPSHQKLNTGKSGKLDHLVINGAECEPFITCDDVLMRERGETMIRGIAILRELVRAENVLIGIEDNKPEAIAATQAAIDKLSALGENTAGMRVVAVPTRYPAGGAKQLIRVLTGIEVPHGKRSTSYGVQCFNVGTALAIYDAVALGQPLISRIITVAGNVERPGNFEARFGAPMRDLVALAGPRPDSNRIVMGGPMMGVSMPGDEVPVVKATNCILVGSPKLFPPPPPEMPCIRCGACAFACPSDLQPYEMYWFARARNFGKAQEYHLFDCIECGACAYVCPSHIPLVDYYRFAKTEIWAHERDNAAAERARARYELRTQREEREKAEKVARLAAKTAAAHEQALVAAAEQAPAEPPIIDHVPPEPEIEAMRLKIREMAKTTPPEEE